LSEKVNLTARDLPGWKVVGTASAPPPPTFDRAFYRCVGVPDPATSSVTEASDFFYTGRAGAVGFRSVRSLLELRPDEAAATKEVSGMASAETVPCLKQYFRRNLPPSEPQVVVVSSTARDLSVPGAPSGSADFQAVVSFAHKSGPPTEETADAVYFAMGRGVVMLDAEALSLGRGGPPLSLVGHLAKVLSNRAHAVRSELR
jgi:hypothetical protein